MFHKELSKFVGFCKFQKKNIINLYIFLLMLMVVLSSRLCILGGVAPPLIDISGL
jgi:hypothetical protein